MQQYRVCREDQQARNADAEQAGAHAHNKGFGVEHAGNVLFPGAQGAQHADLLGAFQHGDIGDNPDHQDRDDKGDGGKGDQHDGDCVHNIARQVGNHGGEVVVKDHVLVRAAAVVCVEIVENLALGVKIDREDVDHHRRRLRAEVGQQRMLGVLRRLCVEAFAAHHVVVGFALGPDDGGVLRLTHDVFEKFGRIGQPLAQDRQIAAVLNADDPADVQFQPRPALIERFQVGVRQEQAVPLHIVVVVVDEFQGRAEHIAERERAAAVQPQRGQRLFADAVFIVDDEQHAGFILRHASGENVVVERDDALRIPVCLGQAGHGETVHAHGQHAVLRFGQQVEACGIGI